MTIEEILLVENLNKHIKGKKIIHNLSFRVNKGQIFGFLGPNGSGKTTTIRMMTGMIKPTSGSIKIMGYDVEKKFEDAILNLGAIVENPALYFYMSGWQNLIQSIRISNKEIDEKHINWCVETVGLTNRIHEKVSNYSLGMKQRLAIAQSLIASPKILILDEPTNGMDPSGIKDIRALIKKLAHEHQITIFLSSHLLSEIENVCDQVLIINKGKQIALGPVKHLIQENTSEYHLTLDPSKIEPAYQLINQKGVPVFKTDNQLIVHSNKNEIPHIVNILYKNEIFVYLLNQKKYTLEEYFLSVTQEVV